MPIVSHCDRWNHRSIGSFHSGCCINYWRFNIYSLHILNTRILNASETSLFHQQPIASTPVNAHWLTSFLILSFIFRAIAISFYSHLFSNYKWYFIHSELHLKPTTAASIGPIFLPKQFSINLAISIYSYAV